MSEKEHTDHKPEHGSLVDEHGFDNVMRGLLAVKPKTEEKDELKKRKTHERNK